MTTRTSLRVPYPRGVLMPDYTKLIRDAAAMSDFSSLVGRGVMSDFSSLVGRGVMSDFSSLVGRGVVPDYSSLVGRGVVPDYSSLVGRGVVPDFSSLVGRGVMSDYSKLIGDAAAMPDFSRALRQVVAAPRIVDSILSSIRVPSVASVAGYRTATEALLRSMGFDHESELPGLSVRPTSDDTAFRVIAQASPETAAAISLAADKARNPLLPSHIIRNMLAWLVVGLIVIAYVVGTVLFPPWGPIVVALLSSSGATAPAVYRKISQPPHKNQA